MKEQYKVFENKMIKSIENLNKEYVAIKAGRANVSALDKIKVEYYGTNTPINQMAAISISEARVLVIQPWDASTIQLIEKAINTS
ncbi:MAG: ribosome recycling factor, partial [Oscillospiraceae bacterium]